MSPVEIPPLSRRTENISVVLAAHLERLIATGSLTPGDRLPAERDLAATLQVSRATLREAMHELENKHLIERRPGRGTVVVERTGAERELLDLSAPDAPSREERDAAELREIVEPAVAGLAAQRATAANLLQLREVLDRTAGETRAEGSLECDIEFHLLVARAAGNPLVSTLHTLMTDWTMGVRRHSHTSKEGRRTSLDGHRAVYDAIERHDAEGARRAMAEHLGSVRGLIARRAH
ncbi:FadR/GntR family transcriptional regulator [Cellulomonas iranensis]|uniref:FadR/GntR family transcriptional regulator n=1 Tax=Cellulomonas iranensis TaxID=76862 RepID=UPI000B3C9B6B|nr:FadR/GntR family transcriptional regulator [Cellulomonas iranensis]UCN15843.1 FadR family transcriptional regulator [Cellulomonas iranensis]